LISLEFDALTLITSSLHVREMINGALFVLCTDLAILIAFFMARAWATCGDGEKWKDIPGMATACILSWVFAIIGLRCGFAWWALKLANDGLMFSERLEMLTNSVLIVSAIVLAIVTLRATFIWTPPEWHNKAWVMSGALAIIFLSISELF
jgi:hypothetical protein